jgi:outer membrane lipoprotein-sorting protein
MMRITPLAWMLLTAAVLLMSTRAEAATVSPAVASWLAAQTNVQTWSADFRQVRQLKSLTQPLIATGQVCFAAPDKFRWELGKQTIAVRAGTELTILYPELKRAERFSLANQRGPWKDALALLETGFPRSESDLLGRFNLVSQIVTNSSGQVLLQPKSTSARRMMPQIRVQFDTSTFSLLATELTFADGSIMRNEFTNAVLNPVVRPDLFKASIPADFKIADPLK